jgi:hypothetical protein
MGIKNSRFAGALYKLLKNTNSINIATAGSIIQLNFSTCIAQ